MPSDDIAVPVSERSRFDALGPFYDRSGMRTTWAVDDGTIDSAIESSRLLGCRTADGFDVFPVWQFEEGTMVVLDGLPEILAPLRAAFESTWNVAVWLTTPTDLFQGEPALALIRRGLRSRVLAAALDEHRRWSQ